MGSKTDMKSSNRLGKWERKKGSDNTIHCHRTEDVYTEP